MEKSSCKVCVTGSAGYIGSALVKNLLQKGYTVHATVRNLNEQSKVGLLKSFPDADTRLHLFEADIYKPEEFERAIEGCEFVFHVATPWFHSEGYEYKNRIEATVAAVRSILMSCIKSRTVRRLIYTASVTAASPLKDDGTGYKETMDETCWTPLNLTFAYSNDYVNEYTQAKTQAEKEILNTMNDDDDANGLEVVTLACGLVGGNTHLSYIPETVGFFVAHITDDAISYQALKFLEELIGKLPVVHVEDVCRAHIFCIETPSIKGRFLCASSYIPIAEIAKYYHENYPKFNVKKEYLEGPNREIEWGSTKLQEKGFVYKYDTKMILDDCINLARNLGVL